MNHARTSVASPDGKARHQSGPDSTPKSGAAKEAAGTTAASTTDKRSTDKPATSETRQAEKRVIDPMRPPDFMLRHQNAGATQSGGVTAWQVSSVIITSTGKNGAIINGKAVSEGELIDDARVVKIVHNKVTIRQGARDIELPVLPETPTETMSLRKRSP